MIRPRRKQEPASVARHYDELDDFYRELWGEDLHHGLWLRGDEEPAEAIQNLSRLIADRARVRAGDQVCDVGCGYGGTARYLVEHHDAHVVGLTLSEAQHRHALGRVPRSPGFQPLLRDWMDNGLADESFDVVLSIESASHMPDKPAFLRECWRVLRPGGRLVMAAWLASEDPGRWEKRHLLEPICSEGRLPGLATESEYARWIAGSGLGVLRFEDLSRQVRRTWTLSLARLLGLLFRDRRAFEYLTNPERSERAFALSVGRIWLAYRTGAMRYGVFTVTKPDVYPARDITAWRAIGI